MVHELRARVLLVCLEGFELQGPRRLPGRADERRPRRDARGGRGPRAGRPPLARPRADEGRFSLRRAAAEARTRPPRSALGKGLRRVARAAPPWPCAPAVAPLRPGRGGAV